MSPTNQEILICLNPDIQRNTIMEFQKIKNVTQQDTE